MAEPLHWGTRLGLPARAWRMTAVHGLKSHGGRRALVTMCIGVGQGLSLALEKV